MLKGGAGSPCALYSAHCGKSCHAYRIATGWKGPHPGNQRPDTFIECGLKARSTSPGLTYFHVPEDTLTCIGYATVPQQMEHCLTPSQCNPSALASPTSIDTRLRECGSATKETLVTTGPRVTFGATSAKEGSSHCSSRARRAPHCSLYRE